jgi:hypothetical protein
VIVQDIQPLFILSVRSTRSSSAVVIKFEKQIIFAKMGDYIVIMNYELSACLVLGRFDSKKQKNAMLGSTRSFVSIHDQLFKEFRGISSAILYRSLKSD